MTRTLFKSSSQSLLVLVNENLISIHHTLEIHKFHCFFFNSESSAVKNLCKNRVILIMKTVSWCFFMLQDMDTYRTCVSFK